MKHITPFLTDTRGTTALVFALTLVPVFGLGGAALDYSRAAATQSSLQSAVDSTALLLGHDAPQLSDAQLRARGEAVFQAQFKNRFNAKLTPLTIARDSRTIKVSVNADVPMVIMPIIGKKTQAVSVSTEVIWGAPNTEVALAIDNTGSMREDMAALKIASEDFTNTILSASDGNNIRMSLIPYVASVNVGSNFPTSMLDERGDSRWHAQALKSKWVGKLNGCNDNPYYTPPAGGGGGGPWVPPPPEPGPRGSDRTTSLWPSMKTFAVLTHELFGISSAQAAQGPNVTPDTNPYTYRGTQFTPGAPYVQNNEQGFVPDGFSTANNCYLVNPSRISNLDLFDRIGVRWKGCVEARPAPYDVTEDEPRLGNANSQFVPYFWPDEPGKSGEKTSFINNYMNDTPNPQGWGFAWEDMNFANLIKYNPQNRPTVVETGPKTTGPNAGCPDELMRLTSNKQQVIDQIRRLTHWESGGTIISEGVMWGWRTLSPKAPFADGRPYGQAKKFLVVMSDGINSLQENNRYGPTKTDYTAYGYLANGRFPSDQFVDAENYLGERMRLACTNAKNAGIKVYTILYRETSQIGRDAMRSCASDLSKAYFAATGGELRNVFNTIAGEIVRLRVSK